MSQNSRALLIAALLVPAALPHGVATADTLPTGYLVWSQGKTGDPGSRRIHRMTLPGKTDVKALTAGEDVECQVSPDGKWVAYAKAKLAGGSDYHSFKLWKLYIVSIHGALDGRKEIKIDDDGAWPSWGGKDVLYYNQPEGTHTKIIRVQLDSYGAVTKKETFFDTRSQFSSFREVNECFVAPDGSWFAGRTRGAASVNGVGAYQISPAKHLMLARAGSIGCMPYVAPDGAWGLIAGAEQGIRWGHGPAVKNRLEDQLLIPPPSASHKAYHPGVSSDGKWVLVSFGTDTDHNSGAYAVQIYPLDSSAMSVGSGQSLAGDGFNGWPHVWVGAPSAPPPPEPRVLEFYPSSYTVGPGEKATLTWTTSGADQVTLDGATVATDGTRDVTPAASATYTLAAASSKVPGKSHSASCTVTVNASLQAVSIEKLEASPASIEQGRGATLSWVVNNPTTLDLDGARVAPLGSLEVSPAATTTYVLTARGHQGPVTASVTVAVTGIDSGLLPDRGGFVCAAVPHGSAAGAWLPALLLAGLLLARTRRRRRR